MRFILLFGAGVIGLVFSVAAPNAQDAGAVARSSVIAHRSADLGTLPENSLPWIAYAIEKGIDAIHINPQVTGDGAYMLMHDPTLNRMTDVETVFPAGPAAGPGREQRGGRDFLRDYSSEEIAQLHLVAPEGQDRPHIPGLDEALDLAQGRATVLLGLKAYDVDSLAGALEGRDTSGLFFHELVVHGTDQSKLAELSSRTGIGVAASLYQSTDFLGDVDAAAAQLGPSLRMVIVNSRGLTPEFSARLRDLGVTLIITGWNGPEDSALIYKDDPGPWSAILEQGFWAMTDYPVEVVAVRDR